MNSTFSSLDLTKVMAFALRHFDRDCIQLAIRACRAAGEDAAPHFLPTLDELPANKSYLRAAFEWAARYGLVDVIKPLETDARPAVAYAASFAVAEAAAVQAAIARGKEPEDVRAFRGLSSNPVLTVRELSMASVILGRPLLDANSLMLSLRNLGLGVLREPLYAMAASGALNAEDFVRAVVAEDGEPSSPFLAALAALHDEAADQTLFSLAERFPDSKAISTALALRNSSAALERLLERVGRPSAQVREALGLADPALASEVVLAAYQKPGEIRRKQGVLTVTLAGAHAIEPLLEALTDPLRAVRDSAMLGLLSCGERAPIEQVAAALETISAASQLEAVSAIWRSRAKPAEPLLARILQDEAFAPRIRIACVSALERGASDLALAALASRVNDPVPEVRNAVLGALLSRASSSQKRPVALLRALMGAFLLADTELRAHIESVLDAAPRWPPVEVNDVLADVTAGLHDDRLRAWLQSLRAADDPTQSQEQQSLRAGIEGDFFGGSFGSGVVREGPASLRSLTTEPPQNIESSAYFSVIAASSVMPETMFLVEVWCHPDSPPEFVEMINRMYKNQADRLRTQGPFPVGHGLTVEVELVLGGFTVEEPRETMTWESRTGVVSFAVKANLETPAGSYLGAARIHIGGLRIATVRFVVELGRAVGPGADQTAHVERYETAFASYASEDRDQVIGRIQGMEKVLPSLRVFLDVMSLRSGEKWAERLGEEIRSRDVLFLFWSRAARDSKWVDLEWRTALVEKGLDGISPVPLESPTIAPPPPELSSLHFGDWTLAFRSA